MAARAVFTRWSPVGAHSTVARAREERTLSGLVAADFGELTTNNTAIVIGSGAPLSRWLNWKLDHLGNWAGEDPNDPNAVPGLRRIDDPNSTGTPTYDQWIWQAPNLANEIDVLREEVNGDPNLTVQTAFVHDRAGNLVWDGRLFYQYDGYNRLVQVHAATQLVLGDFNADGQLVYDPNDPNSLPLLTYPALATFYYDGLGRLIVTERSDLQAGAQQGTQVAEYWYDGVRRIQEIENTVMGSAPPVPVSTVTREYVWGPGYVDELVAIYEAVTLYGGGGEGEGEGGGDGGPPLVYYALLDANYNVAALVDAAGNVVRQYAYEPYGGVVFADEPGYPALPRPTNRVGHQGLFFERFCLDPADRVTDPALTPLDAGARPVVGLYYNRNRWYSRELGRFVARDMKESAMPVITALVRNGQAWDLLLAGLSAVRQYGDGMNLYLYLDSNPLNRSDALGLDPFDDIDEIIGEVMGERMAAGAATLAQVGMFFNSAAMIGQFAFSFLPGSDAVKLGVMLAMGRGGELGWSDLLGAGVDLAGGPLFKAASRFGRMLFHYSRRGSALKLMKHGDEYTALVGRACNCFVAGTLVETPSGPTPVESLSVGDVVLTCSQNQPPDCGIPNHAEVTESPGGPAHRAIGATHTRTRILADGTAAPFAHAPASCPGAGQVTRVFRSIAPVVLWLTLSSGQVLGTTPGHEVWTMQDGWTHAGRLAPGAIMLDVTGAPVEVVEVAADSTPTVVYNIEVAGTYTYFAQGVWVHNNSCDIIAQGYRTFSAGNFRHNLIVRTGINPGDAFQAHHVFPQALAEDFQNIGLNVHSPVYGAWISSNVHPHISSLIEREWRDFFSGVPSSAEALRLAREQAGRYGFVVTF